MLGENLNFIPDPRAISMENRWSDLSEQIQWSGVMRQAALALMLYQCNSKAIRMPVPVAVGADEQCPDGEPTTNIIGRDGQCVNVYENQYDNGNPIILFACRNAKGNQLWTFKSDGTIRSNGKCLTTYGYASGDDIMICDGDTTMPDATKWQARSAGNYTQPTINYISGFREMCLQANGANARVWLANCVIGTEPRQQWALYGDSTIRLYSDRTLCVTSDGHKSSDSIILLKCQGSGDERWTFMADGTILNPNARLVMDVQNSDPSLQDIILYQPTGTPNQNWLAF
ncbi:ribosome-inactivating protein [Tanacetum coccineum]